MAQAFRTFPRKSPFNNYRGGTFGVCTQQLIIVQSMENRNKGKTMRIMSNWSIEVHCKQQRISEMYDFNCRNWGKLRLY